MVASDLTVSGRCSPIVCDPERIRKVNVTLSSRGRQALRGSRQVLRTSLLTQISLRSLSFVDRYE